MRPHYYTDNEFERMLAACIALEPRKDHRSALWWQTSITLLHDCGMRLNDVLRTGLGTRGDLLHGVRKGFVRIRNLAGIKEGCIHDMRRTFITNWARRPEVTPKEVQALAGHADIKTTTDIYAMVSQQDVVAKLRRLMRTR